MLERNLKERSVFKKEMYSLAKLKGPIYEEHWYMTKLNTVEGRSYKIFITNR